MPGALSPEHIINLSPSPPTSITSPSPSPPSPSLSRRHFPIHLLPYHTHRLSTASLTSTPPSPIQLPHHLFPSHLLTSPHHILSPSHLLAAPFSSLTLTHRNTTSTHLPAHLPSPQPPTPVAPCHTRASSTTFSIPIRTPTPYSHHPRPTNP